MRRMLIIAATVAFAALGLAVPAPRDAWGPNLFPLAKGARWEYRRTIEVQAGTDVKSLDVRVGEVAGGRDGAAVTITGDFEYLGFGERMLLTAEGVSYRGGQGRGEKPLALVRNAAKAGDQWDSLMPIGCGGFANAKATAGDPEEVEVPAGKFKAVKVTYSAFVFNYQRTMLVWYADGVGVVKQVYCPDSTNIVIELVKYTPGK